MTTEERAELAVNYKASGSNCCQAVLKAYADQLSPDLNLSALGAGFGVGMGCMEATCGALVGAGIVAGLKSEGKGTIRFSREILAKFQEKSGATVCKVLKGLESGKILCPCDECVRNAVFACDEVLD